MRMRLIVFMSREWGFICHSGMSRVSMAVGGQHGSSCSIFVLPMECQPKANGALEKPYTSSLLL